MKEPSSLILSILINLIESACQKNFNALITSPYCVSTDRLNKITTSHAILIPMKKNRYFTKYLINEFSEFLSEVLLIDDINKCNNILIAPALSSPVKIPGHKWCYLNNFIN